VPDERILERNGLEGSESAVRVRRALTVAAVVVAFALGVLTLLGWVLGIPALTQFVPSWAPVRPGTGLACLLAASSLAFVAWGRPRAAAWSARATALWSATALVQSAFVSPSAAGFLMFALALGIPDHRSRQLRTLTEALVLGAWFLSFQDLVGHAFGAVHTEVTALVLQMAPSTALALLLLCTGALASRRDWHTSAILSSPGPGGIICRRLLPLIVIVIPLLGWLRLFGQRQGWYGTEFGLSLMVVLTVQFLGLGALWSGATVRAFHAAQLRAEAESLDLQRRFRRLLDSSGEGIYGLDSRGRCTFINDTAGRLLGYAPAEVVGLEMHALIHHSHADGAPYPLADCPIFAVLRTGRGCRIEDDALWRRDGTSFAAEYSSFPLEGIGGRIDGAVVTFRDITERRRSLAERAEQNARLARSESESRRQAHILTSVLDSIADGVVVADTAGRFIHFNPAAERILGRGPSDAPADQWSDHYGVFLPDGTTPYPPENLPLARAMRGELVVEAELFIRHPARPVGARVSVNGGPVLEEGEVHGGVVVFRDETERKENDARLRRYTEALAKSNAELQQFAYVASHDLQEPLRMVRSYAQLISEQYKGRLDAEADEYLEFLVDGARRMQQLIADLLAYSRVGTQGRELEPTDCNDVLGDALRNLEFAIEESGARVTHDPLPTVRGDAPQLVRLFQNLVGNAVKFRGDAPPTVHVSVRRMGGEWEFSVADNGIGIPERALDRVFEIFHRVHGRSEYAGTGIGLAICKKTVARHGGRIWVRSTEGVGSTFFFTLTAEDLS